MIVSRPRGERCKEKNNRGEKGKQTRRRAKRLAGESDLGKRRSNAEGQTNKG